MVQVVHFLQRHWTFHIKLLEADAYDSGLLCRLLEGVDYRFVHDEDPVFYRTRYHNRMAVEVQTPILSIWDADVLAPPAQINDALEALRNNACEVAFPYQGLAWDVSKPIRDLYVETGDESLLYRQQGKMKPLHEGMALRGGIFFMKTEAYRVAGMENTAFYGWGSEDFERYDRWSISGYRIHLVPGVLYHLTHPRGKNSAYYGPEHLMESEQAIFTTRVSSAEELRSMQDNIYCPAQRRYTALPNEDILPGQSQYY